MRQTSMPSAGFESATPATKRPQTYALDRAATEVGLLRFKRYITADVERWLCCAKYSHKSVEIQ
jgi:hypothetical protein